MTIAVLIPVLSRPHRVAPLVASLRASVTPGVGPRLDPVFIASPNDHAEIQAIRKAGLEPLIANWQPGHGDYSRKMQLGFRETPGAEFVFLAADDVRFHPFWASEALAVAYSTGACVVGTNDLGNRRVMSGVHSTHTLIHRAYGECGTIDDPKSILCQLYGHQFVDDELVGTAKYRETWAFAKGSLVEHDHPHWGKGVQDATYAKGQASFEADRALFVKRRPLWGVRA